MGTILRGTYSSGRIRDYIQCDKCTRSQSIDTNESPGGVFVSEAVNFGWDETETGWLCPFCSDKGTTKLFEIFKVNAN